MSAMSEAAAYLYEIEGGDPSPILATLRQAEVLAANLGQRRLAGELYALGCYLGSGPAPTPVEVADVVDMAERYHAAVTEALSDPANRLLRERAEARYHALTRLLDALRRRGMR